MSCKKLILDDHKKGQSFISSILELRNWGCEMARKMFCFTVTLALALSSIGCDDDEPNLGDDWYKCSCHCTNSRTGQGRLTEADACADSMEEAYKACDAACNNAEDVGVYFVWDIPPVTFSIEDCYDGPTLYMKDNCPLSSSYRVMAFETSDSIKGDVPELEIGQGDSPRATFKWTSPTGEQKEITIDFREGGSNPSKWGEIVFAGGICPGRECYIHFEKMIMNVPTSHTITIDGDDYVISDFKIINTSNFIGHVDIAGNISLISTPTFAASAYVNGDFYSRELEMEEWNSYMDLGAREVVIDMVVENDIIVEVEEVPGRFYETPPIALIDAPVVAECAAPVVLDGSSSFDPDGDDIQSFDWYEYPFTPSELILGSGPTIDTTFDVGPHLIWLSTTGPDDKFTFGAHGLVVEDTIPPDLQANGKSVCLWPPSHGYVVLDLEAAGLLEALDSCDPEPKVEILEVISSQPDDGVGDGNTTDDGVVVNGGEVCVRVERSGTDPDGRKYNVRLRASDASGNKTEGQFEIVVVPHDRSGDEPCLHTRGGPGNPLRQVDTCPVSEDSESGLGCSYTSASWYNSSIIPVGILFLVLFIRRNARRSRERTTLN